MTRKGISAEELLEFQVESSGYTDAKDVIEKIKTQKAKPADVVVWLDEITYFTELFYPVDPQEVDLTIAQDLWIELLACVINEKSKLMFCAQQIIKSFGGVGQILDVRYDQPAQRLIWKVKYPVDWRTDNK